MNAPAPAADLLTAAMDLRAEVGLHFGRMNDQLARIHGALTRPPRQPVWARDAKGDVADANGNLILSFGGPIQGHYWHVRQLAVGGSDPSQAPAGVADVFISAASPSLLSAGSVTPLTSLGLADWRDRAPSLPLLAWYSPGDLTLYPPHRLYVVFTGALVGTQLVAVCQIEEHDQSALPQVATA